MAKCGLSADQGSPRKGLHGQVRDPEPEEAPVTPAAEVGLDEKELERDLVPSAWYGLGVVAETVGALGSHKETIVQT